MARILIVDDDPAILEILGAYLSAEGYEVLRASDGQGAGALLPQADLAILDWMLPGVSGPQLARDARRAGLELPILLLTARSEEEDKLRGLDGGADDYVVKPFSPREVMARVRALLRRSGVRESLRSGGLTLDQRTRRAAVDGQQVELSKLEYDLLSTFVQHPGLVWTRERLLERIWGGDFPSTARVVDVHVTSLRRKLGDDAERPRFIETVRGVGYRLKESGPEGSEGA